MMRKIILNLALSLDGFTEGPAGEYDWYLTDQDYGMANFFADTDAIFIGRKSYEMISADEDAFAGKKVYVFSDTLPGDVNSHVEVISSAAFDDAVARILNQPGKNIYLFGGASLITAFIDKNLVAGIILSVHPVLLGGGKPLFADIKDKVELIFTGQQCYDTGLVQLKYTMKPKFDMEMLKLL